MHYDVFNGDADGIIALLQLRLSQKEQQPNESTLITGVKRDISLLKQVDVNIATSVTVLDISLEKNNEALAQLLEKEVNVFYVDHHRTGEIPQSKRLVSLLDTDANTCTSLLVNKHLGGEFAPWAIAAAFGDNMENSAETLSDQHNLTLTQKSLLKELGVYINYNGYGRSVDDLHFHPADLFKKLLNYVDPFTLINEQGSVFSQLQDAYLADMNKAKSADVLVENATFKAVQLADEAWARRVSGVFGNDLANVSPNKAHAVLTLNADNSYTVSLRAPLSNKQGAGDICANFPTGGGRAAAAGINALPQEMLSDFFDSVSKYYA
jgi:nanoRNase/pAp phosphatase (c-di-AMP/oligoRNAs hydrolase)